MSDRLFKAIEDRVARVQEYVLSPRYLDLFSPEDMREAVTCYFESGGKRLRPAVMLFCCGAVGGDEEKAISAAAAVEIFHTWTLVHDDIIDRDPLRRGAPTVHERFRVKPSTIARFGNGGDAAHYGVSIAVLTGDVQHGWGISLMTELTRKFGIAPEVTLTLINELDTRVLCTLVEGEVLDVQYSKEPIENLSSEQIEEMLWKKTGALYEFAGASGARGKFQRGAGKTAQRFGGFRLCIRLANALRLAVCRRIDRRRLGNVLAGNRITCLAESLTKLPEIVLATDGLLDGGVGGGVLRQRGVCRGHEGNQTNGNGGCFNHRNQFKLYNANSKSGFRAQRKWRCVFFYRSSSPKIQFRTSG